MKRIAVPLALLLAACAPPQVVRAPGTVVTASQGAETDLTGTSYWAAERLLNASQVPLDRSRPILVASLVELDNLERSSTLGRLISEQAGSRLAQMGYIVHEIKLRESLLVRRGQGELILSRDGERIGARFNAQAVLAGIYAVGRSRVFVDLRLIRAEDGRVIASFDFTVPLTPDVRLLVDPYGTRTGGALDAVY